MINKVQQNNQHNYRVYLSPTNGNTEAQLALAHRIGFTTLLLYWIRFFLNYFRYFYIMALQVMDDFGKKSKMVTCNFTTVFSNVFFSTLTGELSSDCDAEAQALTNQAHGLIHLEYPGH